MSSVMLTNNIHNKLERIKNKDPRYAEIKLAVENAKGDHDLKALDFVLTLIIDKLEQEEEQEYGV